MADKETSKVNEQQKVQAEKAGKRVRSITGTASGGENKPAPKEMTREQLEALRSKLQKKFH